MQDHSGTRPFRVYSSFRFWQECTRMYIKSGIVLRMWQRPQQLGLEPLREHAARCFCLFYKLLEVALPA